VIGSAATRLLALAFLLAAPHRIGQAGARAVLDTLRVR